MKNPKSVKEDSLADVWAAMSQAEQEQAFHEAMNGASYWGRKRLLKKMSKRVHKNRNVRFKNPRLPQDLEAWVTNFVLVNRGKFKGGKNGDSAEKAVSGGERLRTPDTREQET